MNQHDQIQVALAKYQELRWRVGILSAIGSPTGPDLTDEQVLAWHKHLPAQSCSLPYTRYDSSLNQHFHQLFPAPAAQFGPAFLEGINNVPLCVNHDFFAYALSDPILGLNIIYFEQDQQFFYNQPSNSIYNPVSSEKLQTLYRALLLRASGILKDINGKLNIWAEFRSDKNSRIVAQRAKTILAAAVSFFSATSPHQRIKGPELTERVASAFVEQVLERQPNGALLLTDAYAQFCQYLKQRDMEPVNRHVFKSLVSPVVKQQYEVSIRHDIRDLDGGWHCGWKGIGALDLDSHRN